MRRGCEQGSVSLRSVTEIAAELDTLTSDDFDDMNPMANGMARLQLLCDEITTRRDPEEWAPLLFSFVERMDLVDLGTPGPLVHVLERWHDGYRRHLAESIRRKPTPLTVWMVNRVLNAGPSDAPYWMDLLEGVERSSSASDEAVEEARQFLQYQRSRR